jgi:hypothetical protein
VLDKLELNNAKSLTTRNKNNEYKVSMMKKDLKRKEGKVL